MQLKITLEHPVQQPAVSSAPAGPDVPLMLTFFKNDDSPLAHVLSQRGAGVPSLIRVSKAEAEALGNWYLSYARGAFD